MFQSTPLCKGRQGGQTCLISKILFQSTPLCKGRLPVRCRVNSSFKFQSTPLCKGRRKYPLQQIIKSGFNPRPYARGDPGAADFNRIEGFQSTPLCKGRQALVEQGVPDEVSIHAPMQGATLESAPPAAVIEVSIHAPMQGATVLERKGLITKEVSIHAPMQGATWNPVADWG